MSIAHRCLTVSQSCVGPFFKVSACTQMESSDNGNLRFDIRYSLISHYLILLSQFNMSFWINIVHCSLFIVHCSLFIVHCTLYFVLCTLYFLFFFLLNFSYHLNWSSICHAPLLMNVFRSCFYFDLSITCDLQPEDKCLAYLMSSFCYV